eukprot:6485597-Prymnesium_polylepis.1
MAPPPVPKPASGLQYRAVTDYTPSDGRMIAMSAGEVCHRAAPTPRAPRTPCDPRPATRDPRPATRTRPESH